MDSFATADLCDAHPEVQVLEARYADLGGRRRFAGPIRTLRVFEDNSLVREAVESPGGGAVLVVDGGGSRRTALVGDKLARSALENGWAGLLVHGAVRDTVELARLGLGLRALAVQPRRSVKEGRGERDVAVTFGGVRFEPGAWLYAEEDRLVVAAGPLT
jgi:regulator of ribonuclease activity A